jgi:hypothetical protein
MVMNYKYPMFEYPYGRLVGENRARSREDPEFELFDASPESWVAGEFWDITITYAKGSAEDILCRIVATNCSKRAETLHILPQLVFRNTWSWGYDATRPWVRATQATQGTGAVHTEAFERHLGPMRYAVTVPTTRGSEIVRPAELLVTDNDTNAERLWGSPNVGGSTHTKDAFHTHVCGDNASARDAARARIKPQGSAGTKAGVWTAQRVAPGASCEVWVRFQCRSEAATVRIEPRSGLSPSAADSEDGAGGDCTPAASCPLVPEARATAPQVSGDPRASDSSILSALPLLQFEDFLAILATRKAEADAFYATLQRRGMSDEDSAIQRQGFAGLLWSKQYYHYGVGMWLEGDPAGPPPPRERLHGRNSHWHHYYANDVLSMPDKYALFVPVALASACMCVCVCVCVCACVCLFRIVTATLSCRQLVDALSA